VLHSGAHFAGPSFFQFHLIIPIMTAFKQLRELLTRATFQCALSRALFLQHYFIISITIAFKQLRELLTHATFQCALSRVTIAFKQLRQLLTRATFRCALCRALVGVHHLERVDSPRHKCLGHHTHRGALLDRSSRVNLGGAKSFDRSGSKGWGQGVKASRVGARGSNPAVHATSATHFSAAI
jgi:hypothetical protein